MQTTNKNYISWGEFDGSVRYSLKAQLDADHFAPDIVIGIMRGGLIPAIILSHEFNCPCDSIKVSFRDFADTSGFDQSKLILHRYAGKNVLFVEDIVDSGRTMSELQSRLESWLTCCWPKTIEKPNIKYASIIYNESSTTTVDYSVNVIDRNDNDDWFVFPYEKQ